MSTSAVASERRCIGVDRRCRESEGKAKIEGYMSISDEEAHHRIRFVHTKMPECIMCELEKIFSDVSCVRNNEPVSNIPKSVDKLCSWCTSSCEALAERVRIVPLLDGCKNRNVSCD